MTEKIRVDITCYVDIDITPKLKELLDKYLGIDDDDIETYDEISEKIRECINKELYNKGFHDTEILDWNW